MPRLLFTAMAILGKLNIMFGLPLHRASAVREAGSTATWIMYLQVFISFTLAGTWQESRKQLGFWPQRQGTVFGPEDVIEGRRLGAVFAETTEALSPVVLAVHNDVRREELR
jgi:hypothetical protein